jgi:hypothetical protein
MWFAGDGIRGTSTRVRISGAITLTTVQRRRGSGIVCPRFYHRDPLQLVQAAAEASKERLFLSTCNRSLADAADAHVA